MTTEEKTYFQDASVLVTNARFVVNGKTHAMRNISSVQMGVIEPKNDFYYGLAFISLLVLIFGSITFKVIAVLAGMLSIYLIYQSKKTYTVMISSNSGEIHGLSSHDDIYISEVIRAINNAIISN